MHILQQNILIYMYKCILNTFNISVKGSNGSVKIVESISKSLQLYNQKCSPQKYISSNDIWIIFDNCFNYLNTLGTYPFFILQLLSVLYSERKLSPQCHRRWQYLGWKYWTISGISRILDNSNKTSVFRTLKKKLWYKNHLEP